jgi:hypothetical protein
LDHASDPLGTVNCQVAFAIAGVDSGLWLEQDDLAFPVGMRAMLDAPGDDEHLPWLQRDLPIAQVNSQGAFVYDEKLVGIGMCMPDEITLHLNQFDQVVIDPADNLWRPELVEKGEFGIDIDWLEFHTDLHED